MLLKKKQQKKLPNQTKAKLMAKRNHLCVREWVRVRKSVSASSVCMISRVSGMQLGIQTNFPPTGKLPCLICILLGFAVCLCIPSSSFNSHETFVGREKEEERARQTGALCKLPQLHFPLQPPPHSCAPRTLWEKWCNNGVAYRTQSVPGFSY